MRKILAISLMFFGISAQADEAKWAREIGEYALGLEGRTSADLVLSITGYAGKTLLTCGGGATIYGATVIADSFPVAGVFAEMMANLADQGYETNNWDSYFSWQAAGDTSRGAAGGVVVAGAESIEFIALWLLGDEERSFQRTREIYESSRTVSKEFFAKDSKCNDSFARTVLLFKELQKRSDDAKESGGSPTIIPMH